MECALTRRHLPKGMTATQSTRDLWFYIRSRLQTGMERWVYSLFAPVVSSAFALAVSMSGCSAPPRENVCREPWSAVCSDRSNEHDGVRLDAFCEVDQEEIVVHVTISNSSDSAVVVNRRLLLLVHLDALDSYGNVIDLKEETVRDDELPRLNEHKHPLGELMPGEKLRRDILLRKGFPEFACATMWSQDRDASPSVSEQGTGWIVIRRLPAECPVSSVRAVVVRYQASFCSRAGIVRVFGYDPKIYHLYEGPLCKVLPLPSCTSAPVTPAEDGG